MKSKHFEGLARGLGIGTFALALNGCGNNTESTTEVSRVRSVVSSCVKAANERANELERLESFSRREDDRKTFGELVNKLRAEKNAAPVSYGDCAQSMAEYWAKHPEAPAGGHEADGETAEIRREKFDCASMVLENVGWPKSLDGADIFQQWNDTPETRANMKFSRTTELGLHCVERTGVKSGNFCVMVGATPKNAEEKKPGLLNLSAEDFEQEIFTVRDKPVLVEFWASYCSYCKHQDRVLQQLERELGDRVVFARVKGDEEENESLYDKYGSNGFPSMAIFKNGELKGKLEGLQQEWRLLPVLKRYLKK